MSARYTNILSKRDPRHEDGSDDGGHFGGWFYSEVRHPPLLDKLHSDELCAV